MRSTRLLLVVFVAAGVSLWFVVSDFTKTTAGAKSPTKLGSGGATLGPLLIPLFSHDDVARVHFKPGYATLVVLLPTRRWTGTLVLRGSRVSDGRVLRFAYRDQPLPPPPLSDEDMSRAGTAVARLRPPPNPLPPVGRWGYGGYMLFPDSGNWSIRAFQDGRLVGRVVVGVTPYGDSGGA